MKQKIKIGLIGVGTVGSSIVRVLQKNADEITRRCNRHIVIKTVGVRDTKRNYPCNLDGIQITNDLDLIINDPDISIIVELIGGHTVAREIHLKSITRGKHVVTANKELIALAGNEIFNAADEKNVIIGYEAAVGGGIPIIKVMREGLTANRVECIMAIINGTCNYILTAMDQDEAAFDDVLTKAQELGYAEADPSFDVDGIDAAHKLTILATTAFGIPLQFDRIAVDGIRNISQVDCKIAKQLGFKIKHLAIARRTERHVEMRVHPALIPVRHPLASIDGVMNSVLVEGDTVGVNQFNGAGAGGMATASAIIADIIDVVRTESADPEKRVPPLSFCSRSEGKKLVIANPDQIRGENYLRMQIVNDAATLAKIVRIFADNAIQIETINQQFDREGDESAQLIITTRSTQEEGMLHTLQQLSMIKGVDQNNINRIPIVR